MNRDEPYNKPRPAATHFYEAVGGRVAAPAHKCPWMDHGLDEDERGEA